MSENVAKKRKIISVMAEKDFPGLGKLSNIPPLGRSKNSSFPRFWKVHIPAYEGNSYSFFWGKLYASVPLNPNM